MDNDTMQAWSKFKEETAKIKPAHYAFRVHCGNCRKLLFFAIPKGTTAHDFTAATDCLNCGCKVNDGGLFGAQEI